MPSNVMNSPGEGIWIIVIASILMSFRCYWKANGMVSCSVKRRRMRGVSRAANERTWAMMSSRQSQLVSASSVIWRWCGRDTLTVGSLYIQWGLRAELSWTGGKLLVLIIIFFEFALIGTGAHYKWNLVSLGWITRYSWTIERLGYWIWIVSRQ